MTQFDLSPEKSLENFAAKSLLCQQDVLQLLDAWLGLLRDDGVRIEMSSAARLSLHEILTDMKHHVLDTSLPDILPSRTGTRYRYCLDWYRDGLQLGIEQFPDGTLFLEDGTEAPPAINRNSTPVDDAPAQPENGYRLLHKSHAGTIRLDDWAKLNDVPPDTARHWAKTCQIPVTHEHGIEYVSDIEYTPDAYRAAPDIHHRFKYVGQLPKDVTEKIPGLDGMVLDLLIVPADGGHRLLTIRLPEGKQDPVPESHRITDEDRDLLLDALDRTEGVWHDSTTVYEEPFDQSARTGLARRPRIDVPSGNDLNRLGQLAVRGTSRTRQATTGTPEDAVDVKLRVEDPELRSMTVTGRYRIYETTAEDRLLSAMTGWAPTDREITRALDALGFGNGSRRDVRPQNRNVLVVDGISSDLHEADAETAVRSLPELIRKALGLEPTLVLAAADKLPDPFPGLFERAGFVHAGRHMLAYARSNRVFTGFQA